MLKTTSRIRIFLALNYSDKLQKSGAKPVKMIHKDLRHHLLKYSVFSAKVSVLTVIDCKYLNKEGGVLFHQVTAWMEGTAAKRDDPYDN